MPNDVTITNPAANNAPMPMTITGTISGSVTITPFVTVTLTRTDVSQDPIVIQGAVVAPDWTAPLTPPPPAGTYFVVAVGAVNTDPPGSDSRTGITKT